MNVLKKYVMSKCSVYLCFSICFVTLMRCGVPNGGRLCAVSDFSIAQVGRSHVGLLWTDNNEGESGYRIERKTEGQDWIWVGSVPAGATTFESGGLDPETVYFHRVCAVQDTVQGPYSDSLRVVSGQWREGSRGRVIESTTVRSDAPTFVRLRNGDLMMYFASFTEMRDKARARIGKKLSTDNGNTWSAMELVYDDPDWHLLHPSLLRMGDGSILLTYSKMIPNTWTAYKVYRVSEDDGNSWSAEKILSDDEYTYNTGSANKSYLLSSDRIVHLVHVARVLEPDQNDSLDQYRSKIFLGTNVFFSDDHAKTWVRSTQEPLSNGDTVLNSKEFGFYECALAEYASGRLVMTGRSQSGWMLISWSDDYGASWSDPVSSGIRNGLSPAWIRQIGNTGDIVLMYNPRFSVQEGWPFGYRWILASMVSSDGGRTWSNYKHFEGDHEHWYQYPSMFFDNGEVHISYHKTTSTSPTGFTWDLMELAYVRLDENWFTTSADDQAKGFKNTTR